MAAKKERPTGEAANTVMDIKGKRPRPPAHPVEGKAALAVYQRPGETEGEAHARSLMSPATNAAISVYNFHPITGGCELNGILAEITKQTAAVQVGDMSGPEGMLVAQAHALDIMFSSFAQRASLNCKAGYMQATETYMKLALKAQSQCRTTIEALGELKQPRSATFIKQANIAQQQQVNNGTGAVAPEDARAREKDITPSNKLLNEATHASLDSGRTSEAVGVGQGVGTMAKVHGATH